MILAILTMLSSISISSVAIFYSVIGLVSIFPSEKIPVIIMGSSLEISKLIASIWLKKHWKTAPLLLKSYLMIAVCVLMCITSMGIFGYLSKAHIDQTTQTGDITDQISYIDEQVGIKQATIDSDKKSLKQMDDSVDQVLSRSSSENGARRSSTLRDSQKEERLKLNQDIVDNEKVILDLKHQELSLNQQQRQSNSEVGPITYIAALVYGSTNDPTLIEKVVRFVIILLVSVFDPMAVCLLLASQYSFDQAKSERKVKDDNKPKVDLFPNIDPVIDEVQETGSTQISQNDYMRLSNLKRIFKDE